MTVPSAVNRNDYLGTGTTGPFPFTFGILAASHMVVTKRLLTTGAETTLVQGVDYTIAGSFWSTGGYLTLTAVLPNTYGLTARRIVPLTQNVDLRNQGAYFPDVSEDVFDLLTEADQQQQDQIGRSLRFPVTELPSDALILPPAAVRALQVLGFDSAGNPIAAQPTGAIVSAALQAIVAAGTLDAARLNFGDLIPSVDTVAALKALAPPATAATYFVRGYTTSGDGGGGFFRWMAGDTNPDNGGTILALGAGGAGRFNRVFWHRDSIAIEEFGGGTAVADNSAALNAATNWGTFNAIKKIIFRAGNYTFATKPNNFTDGFVLEGCSSSQTNLIRNYSAATDSEAFLTWYQAFSNGGGARHLGVIAAAGTTGGTMIGFHTGGQVTGYHLLDDVVVSHFGNGDYYCCVEANGLDNTFSGSQGLRDFRMTNCFLFVGNAGTYTLRLVNATNHTIKGCWTNGVAWITGGGTALTNTTVGIIDMISISNTIIENCTRVKFYGEYNTIQLEASADTIDLFCRVTASLSDFGATNAFKAIAQNFVGNVAPSGYQKLPNGLTIQWGIFAATTGFTNFTFPIAFPTGVLSVQVTAVGAGVNTVNAVVGTVSTTQAAIAASTAGNVYVLAFGY